MHNFTTLIKRYVSLVLGVSDQWPLTFGLMPAKLFES